MTAAQQQPTRPAQLRRIGLAYNPTNAETTVVRQRAEAGCAAHGIETWVAEAEEHEQIRPELASTDLLCIFGGDGTFLRAARAVDGSRVPTLGINLGRIGFLAKVEPDDLERALEQVLAGDYAVEDRFRIQARIVRADGGVEEHACVNEVVVARGSRVRMIQLGVEVSGSHLATYVADGVGVATPTGSTADSFSAGCSILDPRLRNMIITPVAAYLSPLHSVVAGEEQVVSITLRHAPDGALASLDGQVDLPMSDGDRVEVRALADPLCIVEPTGSTPFYDLLRTKAGLLPY